MNWDDLRIFLAVARSGSISGGANQLGVQHSTVSRRIRQLEQKLGVRLLERKKGGYQLTPAGAEVEAAAIRIESEMLGVDAAIHGQDKHLTGPLKVTAINNMASSVPMPMCARFCETHPLVELHVLVSNSDASLPQREADIAIRLTNWPPDTLIGKRIVTVASTIYGRRSYVEQLMQEGGNPKWIGVECCEFHRSWTRRACTGQSHGFVSDDTLLTLAAIKEGLGVSYLPCFMGDADPSLRKVVRTRSGPRPGFVAAAAPRPHAHRARVGFSRSHDESNRGEAKSVRGQYAEVTAPIT